MTPIANPLPPRDLRHHRFADLVLAGNSLVDAYLAAGFKCSRPAARDKAKKLRRRAQVDRYIQAMQAKAADECILSIREILWFCARVVRTGIGDLDPSRGSSTGDLIKSHTSNEGEMGSSFRIEKHCPFKAIETHLKLTGENPEANAIKELAAAIGSLGGPVLPTGKL